MPGEFKNEALVDFTDPDIAAKMEKALRNVSANLGKDYPLIVGGETITTDAKINSIDPANPDQIVGTSSKATREIAEKAMSAATEAFEKWRFVSAAERAEYLFKAAKIIRDNKYDFSAWMCYEVGRVLRPRSDSIRAGTASHQNRGRSKRSRVHSPRRRRRNSAVELPVRHYGRYDDGGPGGG